MRNSIRVCGIAISAALLLASFVPQLRADMTDKRTILTFGGAVEIPGMVLPAGTYVFKLANSQSDHGIVEVFDKDQTRLITTFLTIPDYRLEPADQTVIQFEEREANAPQAIRSWFYPGDSNGLEFVYPKSNASGAASVGAKPAAHRAD